MPLSLNVDVVWPDGRTVYVRCTGVPYVSSREEQLIADEPVVPLFEANVESRESALDFLADATRFAPDRGMLRVSGIELDISRLAKVLGVYGPPPARIVVKVPAP